MSGKKGGQNGKKGEPGGMKSTFRELFRHRTLYLMTVPALIFFLIFSYIPMAGVQIAFRKYNIRGGIWHSPWVGWDNFSRFFNSYMFERVLVNTLTLSFYGLIAGFPLPILFALCLNVMRSQRFKKAVQMVTYAPHFISVIVLCGMVRLFLSPVSGIVNVAIVALGGERINFMAEPGMFRHIYVWSDVWQNTGWGAIVYLAALSGISPELYEAARVDGANRHHIIRYIELPGILPTIIIMLLLKLGSIMNVGFQKAFMLQTTANSTTSEIIATYVYKIGLTRAQYSFSAAIGLFNTAINIALLCFSNGVSKRLTETSLW